METSDAASALGTERSFKHTSNSVQADLVASSNALQSNFKVTSNTISADLGHVSLTRSRFCARRTTHCPSVVRFFSIRPRNVHCEIASTPSQHSSSTAQQKRTPMLEEFRAGVCQTCPTRSKAKWPSTGLRAGSACSLRWGAWHRRSPCPEHSSLLCVSASSHLRPSSGRPMSYLESSMPRSPQLPRSGPGLFCF